MDKNNEEVCTNIENFIKSNECFKKMGENLYHCVLCDASLKHTPKQGIKILSKHLGTNKHIKNAETSENQTRGIDKGSEFHQDLILMMT